MAIIDTLGIRNMNGNLYMKDSQNEWWRKEKEVCDTGLQVNSK